MIDVSSQSAYGRGASGNTRCIAESHRNSRAMSCAVGATGPSGGRRTTMSTSEKRIRYVRFEWPPGNWATSKVRVRSSLGIWSSPRCPRSQLTTRVQSSCSPVRIERTSFSIGMTAAYTIMRIMHFDQSARSQDLQQRVAAFMNEHVYPNEATYHHQIDEGDRWQPTAIVEALKPKARAAGLWNLFLPESEYGAGLTNVEYAPLCEI